jgi:molecular chaperone HscA
MTWTGTAPAGASAGPPAAGVPGLVSSGVPRTRSGLHDSLGANPAVVVEIDDDTGKGSVLDAATGKAKVSADVPLNIEEWVVFDGVAVGTLNSRASAGRDVIAGYGLENLAQLWKVNLPAGASVRGLKPCGPQLVCVKTSGQSGGYVVSAVNVTSGKTAWEKTDAFDAEPWWYVLGGRLIYGKDWFGAIQNPKVLNPANATESRSFGGNGRVYAEAGDANRLVLLDTAVSLGSATVKWNVAVGDHGSGKGTEAVTVGTGDKLPGEIRIVGDVVTVITGDRHLRVLRVGSL